MQICARLDVLLLHAMFKHQYHQTKQDKTSEASSNKIPGQKKPLKFKRSFKAFQPSRARVPEYIQELSSLYSF